MADAELDSELPDFPKRLRALREGMNLSQHELARLCDLGMNQISRYEVGLREPTAGNLVRLARALNVSTDYLVGLTDNKHGILVEQNLNVYEREVLDTFRSGGWPAIGHLSLDRLSK